MDTYTTVQRLWHKARISLIPTLLPPGCLGVFPSPQSIDCVSPASQLILFLLPRFGKHKPTQCCQTEKILQGHYLPPICGGVETWKWDVKHLYLERAYKLILCDNVAMLQFLKAAVVLVDQNIQLYQVIWHVPHVTFDVLLFFCFLLNFIYRWTEESLKIPTNTGLNTGKVWQTAVRPANTACGATCVPTYPAKTFFHKPKNQVRFWRRLLWNRVGFHQGKWYHW